MKCSLAYTRCEWKCCFRHKGWYLFFSMKQIWQQILEIYLVIAREEVGPDLQGKNLICLTYRNTIWLHCSSLFSPEITCPTLSPHNNATQTGSSFRYQDYVTWTCKTGYERSGGDYKVQCLHNRVWNGTNLQCRREKQRTLLHWNLPIMLYLQKWKF